MKVESGGRSRTVDQRGRGKALEAESVEGHPGLPRLPLKTKERSGFSPAALSKEGGKLERTAERKIYIRKGKHYWEEESQCG